MEEKLRLRVELEVKITGERPAGHPDDEHRDERRNGKDAEYHDRADPRQGTRRSDLGWVWRSIGGLLTMAGREADRVGGSLRAPSAYGCCPTDALLWTMVQPFTGRRVGAVPRRRRHPSTIPMCAKIEWPILRRTGPDATPAPSGTATAGRMTTVESDEGVSTDGLGHALRRMRDPVLLLLLPLGFAALDLAYGHGSVDVGFDFRGTLWEPARALLDGAPMYPEPTRAAVDIGNPAVYPPFAILLTAPLAFLSASAASWVWFAALAAAVLASMWIVGVRDWRCLVLALTSPVVLQGLYWGNLTLALLIPLALAWRYRERTTIVGVRGRVGCRCKADRLAARGLAARDEALPGSSWAAASAVVLVVGSWAVVGFDGMLDYPALLRETQDVYATRSDSIAGVLGGLGASVTLAVACCWLAGFGARRARVWVAPREGRRSEGVCVARRGRDRGVADRVAELRRVAVRADSSHVAPARSRVVLRLCRLARRPASQARGRRCAGPPAERPPMVWDLSHATPAAGKALGIVAIVLVVTAALVVGRRAPFRSTGRVD